LPVALHFAIGDPVDGALETGDDAAEVKPTPGRPDLLERDGELTTIDELIAATRGGGGLLVIEGPPGIGKTALISEAKSRGQAVGLRVLSGRGSELESAFTYGVVRQLFEPLVAQMSDPDRAELLTGAAELALPLVDPACVGVETASDASLARLHGLYWLTANIAARTPLLLAIDDLHWSDTASLRWLGYLLPRMEELQVLLVVGLRPAEQRDDAVSLLVRVLSDPLTRIVRPAPLGVAATARVVRATFSEADDAFCRACHEATGGNPLLLRELVSGVAAEGLTPIAANVSDLYKLGARAVSRAVSLRLARVSPEATRLAQAAAVLGEDTDVHVAAALAGLDDATASDATAELVRADVLRQQPPLGFVHPLVHAAVYETLTPLERGAAHARAAQLLLESDAEPERIAAQALLAPPAGEARIVSALREAARRARARGAPDTAVAHLRRALAEPPAESEQAGLLLELGAAEAFVNGPAAVESLQEAHRLIDDKLGRAEVAVVLGRELFFVNRMDESIAVFVDALAELGDADAELQRVLEAGLISTAIFEAPVRDDLIRRLERVREQNYEETPGEKMLLALLAFNDARACIPSAGPVALARRALAGGTLITVEDAGGSFVRACIVLALADQDDAASMYDAALAAAHLQGSISAFGTSKVFRGQVFLMRGELDDAVADCREGLAATREWGFRILNTFRYLLAEALMEQGKLDEAAEALASPGWGGPVPKTGPALVFQHVAARLRMLQGDLAGGLEELLDAGRRFSANGSHNPATMPWRSQAALALLKLGGREPEAQELAAAELDLARAWGAPRALGAALQAAGLVAGGKEGLVLLEEAVDVLQGSPAKLEYAKARTELGAALRRSNRRSDAREHLRRAAELATICGAPTLAARAETELLATGARPRRVALSGVESLTPSERRVAVMAAEGPTNREIAQALFITPKTVEVHLSRVYRKLGISSRAQLRAALGELVGA
jgi:DNA-binding CsgD family transcriptional regulator